VSALITITEIKPAKATTPSETVVMLAEEMDPYHAVLLAFMYGRAKGYRAAKAEK